MRIRSVFVTVVMVSGVLLGAARGGDARTGLSALDAFSDSGHLAASENVLGVVGFYGQPNPPQWLVLTTQAGKKGVLRESVVSGGEVVAERKFRRLPEQDLPSVPLERRGLEVDSNAAFDAADKAARAQKVSFDSAHYQLRCRDLRREPVWMLSLIDAGQVSVGVVYVSAASGEVLRETWRDEATETFSSAKPGPIEARTAEAR